MSQRKRLTEGGRVHPTRRPYATRSVLICVSLIVVLMLAGDRVASSDQSQIQVPPPSIALSAPATYYPYGFRDLNLFPLGTGDLGAAWIENATWVQFRASTAGPSTWGSTSRADDSTRGQRFGLAATADSNGGVHLDWTDFRRIGCCVNETYYTNSFDLGGSWLADKAVYGVQSAHQDSEGGLAVDEDGTVHIVYFDDRYGTYQRWAIWHKSSEDDGITWSAEHRVDPFPQGTATATKLISRPDGELHLLFQYSPITSQFNYASRVYFTRSTDDGVTWSAPVRVDSHQNQFGSTNRYNLFAVYDADDTLHVTWADPRDGDHDIWYSHSSDGGETWSTDVRLNYDTAGHQLGGAICVAGGDLHVVWADQLNPRVLTTSSEDGGLTWCAPTVVNDLPLDTDSSRGNHVNPAIAAVGSQPYVLWTHRYAGVFQLRLSALDVNEPPTADAGANVSIDSADQSTTTINGMAGDADLGDTLTCRWLEGTTILAGPTTLTTTTCALDLSTLSTLPLGDHTLTLEVSDGTETVTDDMILSVANSAPTAAPSGAGCYELGSANSIALNGNVADFDGDTLTYVFRKQGSTTAIASGTVATTAEGAAVSLPGASVGTTALGLGVHTIELAVDDGVNAEVVASIEVEIKDTTGPTLALDCSKTILWPPNHQMVAVTVDPNAADEGGAVTITAAITSNEPQEGTGDGDTETDWSGITVGADGDVALNLRAERSGRGNGRTYTVTITAMDSSGNISVASCEIVVPKSKKK